MSPIAGAVSGGTVDSAGAPKDEGVPLEPFHGREGTVEPPGSRASRRKAGLWTGAGILGILLTAELVAYHALLPSPTHGAIDSIAVLPLENSSQDPEMDYLTEGLANGIADRLAQVSELRVIPSISTSRLRGDGDPVGLARELGVRALLTGALLAGDGDLLIRIELIDTVENRLLWGERFHRAPADLLSLNQEIARAIPEKLRLRLTGEEERRLARQLTADPEAYQLYLKGRHFRKQVMSPEGFRKSVEYLEEATRRDPEFAAAYAALADTYLWAAIVEASPLGEARGSLVAKREQDRVERTALRAIELDPNLVEAHLVLGLARGIFHFNSSVYEGALRKALKLNPRYADAHRELAFHLARADRLEEALKHAKLAQELDPLAPNSTGAVGSVYYHLGDYENAAKLYETALELSLELDTVPRRHFASQLGWVYWKQGRIDDAVKSFEEGQRALDKLYVYRMLGRRDKVEELALQAREDLDRRLREPQPWSMGIAQLQMALGDVDETFRWLNVAYEQRDIFVTNIRTYFLLCELRDDPRFAELHRRIWGSDPPSIRH